MKRELSDFPIFNMFTHIFTLHIEHKRTASISEFKSRRDLFSVRKKKKENWYEIWCLQLQLSSSLIKEKSDINWSPLAIYCLALPLTHHCNRSHRGRKCPSRDILLVLDKDQRSLSSLHAGSAWCFIMHRESSMSPLYCVISICCFFGRYAAGSIRGWITGEREREREKERERGWKGKKEGSEREVCMYMFYAYKCMVCMCVYCDVGAPATVAFWCHAQGERERARSDAHTISHRA